MAMANIKGSEANYSKLEEVLRKSSPGDLESGITLASETIEKHEMDAKLYLLRAKLSFKLLVIKQFRGRVDERIKNCLGDCEQAIVIIERGKVMGDITVMKIEAIQLGYLCCVELNNSQKQGEFEHQLSELGIAIPDTEQTKIELLCMTADQRGDTRTYNLKEMLFPKASHIDPPLLDDVIRCYKERQAVCRNCFYNDLKLSRGFNAKGQCTRCQREFKKLLVIPKSPMTVNFYKSEMIAIPPWPKSKPNELPFESCAKPTDKSKEHKRCLIMSRNSAVWYAHTVEELVIWTVERQYGCSFSEFIRDKEPLQPVTMTATEPTYQLYGPVDPLQTVAGMYYAPALATSQAGSYPVFPVPSYNPAGYFGPAPLPITTAIPYTNEAFISPTSYSVPVTVPFIPVSAVAQSQTEKISQMLDNITFYSSPTSPQVTDDNQQPITSIDVTKDNVSE